MKGFQFQKLVRDNIVDAMKQNGDAPTYRVLTDREYMYELKRKLAEESRELIMASHSELTAELADIQEIIDCLLSASRISRQQLRSAQRRKRDRVGSFTKRLYVERVHVTDQSPWLNHLSSHPEKYHPDD